MRSSSNAKWRRLRYPKVWARVPTTTLPWVNRALRAHATDVDASKARTATANATDADASREKDATANAEERRTTTEKLEQLD